MVQLCRTKVSRSREQLLNIVAEIHGGGDWWRQDGGVEGLGLNSSHENTKITTDC